MNGRSLTLQLSTLTANALTLRLRRGQMGLVGPSLQSRQSEPKISIFVLSDILGR